MSIDAAAHIDSVHLTIPDLDRSIRFYEDRIGLKLHRRDGDAAAMGAGSRDLLWLHESASAPRVKGTTGLYHFAILVPSRADLAAALRHLSEAGTTFQGFADHLVSEAIYLADPDGNGIEIYRDRPRSEWPLVGGVLQMGTEPLDLKSLLSDVTVSWNGLAPNTRIGHVHLHVAELQEAERFYHDALGLDLILRYGDSASFLSAGGYHHHVAINTWAGVGAPRPPAGAVGLDHVVIRVPTVQALKAVGDHLQRAGVPHETSGGELRVSDPSGNRISVQAK
jgi:catechol 2,3-dioxygenase